jgi:Phosphotransferase enzyme family
LSVRRIRAGSAKTPADSRTGSDAPAGTGRGQYLNDACGLLWPYPATVALGRAASGRTRARGAVPTPAAPTPAAPAPAAADSEFILLLSVRRPRLLVPAVPAAAAAAVRGYGQPRATAARLGARALSLALGSRAGGAAFRSRIRVHAPPGTDTIESFLASALGRDVLVSFYLGAARANRKPVLQLLTAQGQPVGFAKIGVNPLTKALVQAEREALTKLGRAGLRDIMVPQVLHYGDWRDMNVLVLSALPAWQRRRPVSWARLAAAMNSVASVGGLRREPLAASSYWQRLTGRLTAADESTARDQLLSALDALSARAGDVPLVLGSWHGDWTPWNMASTRSGLLVWDWERFTSGVPLGFDALHYSLQRDVGPRRREPRGAAAGCIKNAPELLEPFETGGEARLTAILYLADLATRYLADRQAQAGAHLGAAGAWLVPAISDEVKRL